MAYSKEEIWKDFKPKLPEWLDSDEREELMGEIGEYILSEVLDYVGEGKSPVTGEAFQVLSEKYADDEKGGKRLANLDLNGDMMRAVEYQVEADRIKIGIFDEDEAIKAYGHNTGFKGHKWLDGKAPARKFIPNEKENFSKEILLGVKELIDDFLSDIKDQQDEDIG